LVLTKLGTNERTGSIGEVTHAKVQKLPTCFLGKNVLGHGTSGAGWDGGIPPRVELALRK